MAKGSSKRGGGSKKSSSSGSKTTMDKIAKAAMSREMLAAGLTAAAAAIAASPGARRKIRDAGLDAADTASSAATAMATSASKLGSLIAEAVAEAAQRVLSGNWAANDDDAAGAEVGVADLGVAHLTGGQPHRFAGGRDGRPGVSGHEAIPVRLVGRGDRVALGIRVDAPAVQDDQGQRFLLHSFLRSYRAEPCPPRALT